MLKRPPKRKGTLLLENTMLAFESLTERYVRSLLTILGVLIGVLIIIAVSSALNGFRQRLVDNVEQFGTNLLFISTTPNTHHSRPDASIRKRRPLTIEDAEALAEECPLLIHAMPIRFARPGNKIVKFEGKELMGPQIQGATSDEVDEAKGPGVSDGRFFTEQEVNRAQRVCVIGANVKTTLFFHRRAVGKKIMVDGTRFRVIGVMNNFKNSFIGEENPQDSMIHMPITTFEVMYPDHKNLMINARSEMGRVQEAVAQVEEVLRRRRKVKLHEENDFEIGTSQSIIENFDKTVFAAVAVMIALSTVAFMVGGIGVMNIMLASVKERTKEIGIRRALGARRRDITWQFLVEAMVLTGIGGVLGVVAGESLMNGIAALLPAMPVATPMWARAFGFFGSVGVGLVFGLWPAIQAARLDPIETLHYE